MGEDEHKLRAERDGYRTAYFALQEEIGELRRLVAACRTAYETLAHEIRSPIRAKRVASPTTTGGYFLILSNGRTGSTWLLTSLDQLVDVRAWNELKWRGPKNHRTQFPVDRHTVSIKSAIEGACEEPGALPKNAIGSKLVLDPYWFNGPERFDDLRRVIDPDVRLVHLRRDYLDMWLSWTVRGVYHRVNEARAAEIGILPSSISAIPAPDLAPLYLTLRGQPMADAAGTAYPFMTAIDDMLAAFINDLQLGALVRERSGIVIDYSEIAARFAEIAAFVGSTALPREINKVLAKPLTDKLESLMSFVTPIDPLRAVSSTLNRATTSRPPTWRFSDGMLLIDIPELALLLQSWGLTELLDGSTIRWPLRKPLLTV